MRVSEVLMMFMSAQSAFENDRMLSQLTFLERRHFGGSRRIRTGKTYKPNGKREVARRLRQMAKQNGAHNGT